MGALRNLAAATSLMLPNLRTRKELEGAGGGDQGGVGDADPEGGLGRGEEGSNKNSGERGNTREKEENLKPAPRPCVVSYQLVANATGRRDVGKILGTF